MATISISTRTKKDTLKLRKQIMNNNLSKRLIIVAERRTLVFHDMKQKEMIDTVISKYKKIKQTQVTSASVPNNTYRAACGYEIDSKLRGIHEKRCHRCKGAVSASVSGIFSKEKVNHEVGALNAYNRQAEVTVKPAPPKKPQIQFGSVKPEPIGLAKPEPIDNQSSDLSTGTIWIDGTEDSKVRIVGTDIELTPSEHGIKNIIEASISEKNPDKRSRQYTKQEKDYVVERLRENDWNLSKTSAEIGVPPGTLRDWGNKAGHNFTVTNKHMAKQSRPPKETDPLSDSFHYTAEFKQKAIDIALSDQYPSYNKTAKALDISPSTLREWVAVQQGRTSQSPEDMPLEELERQREYHLDQFSMYDDLIESFEKRRDLEAQSQAEQEFEYRVKELEKEAERLKTRREEMNKKYGAA